MIECVIIIILIIIFIIFSISILFVRHLLNKKYKNFVLQNSLRLKEAKEINSKYKFHSIANLNQNHTYDNENFYNEISCKDYLIYQLQFIEVSLKEVIEKINKNKKDYTNYITEIRAIKNLKEFQIPTNKFNLEKLINYEEKMLKNMIRSKPIIQLRLKVSLSRSNIYGYIYETKTETFSEEDIKVLLNKLHNKANGFYKDNEIWQSICKVERGKVSNKMRFSIYKRDGYRCCKCGKSNRNDLEIDHIIPIAKGGKSVYENLQTLCHSCNVKKGDKI
ncbi:MAG: HNH endonuclease [Roseburia sp.]|nr:HNH endonuclease [Anaeroplasma bactoclasticum]MCM1197177.1 HNH endonuclease [Roseburia sp.]MCM1557348.1 HNH endonuclease [Anaeroplasma bactoclasticum]